jgi:hypothetical protein
MHGHAQHTRPARRSAKGGEQNRERIGEGAPLNQQATANAEAVAHIKANGLAAEGASAERLDVDRVAADGGILHVSGQVRDLIEELAEDPIEPVNTVADWEHRLDESRIGVNKGPEVVQEWLRLWQCPALGEYVHELRWGKRSR